MGHTPGPWIYEIPERGGRVLATDARATIVHIPPCSPFNEQAIADAKLIAAAPELLQMLKVMRDPDGDGQWPCYCDDSHYDGTKCEYCLASEVIAKAENET